MPMEIFASCVGDLANIGGSDGCDVSPVTPLLFFLFFFLFVREAGMEIFTLAAPLCCDRVEFLRCGDGSKTKGTLAVKTNTRLERNCIAGLFGVF